ncbi:hypothetical protein SteCoe_17198 [Stentor coeruleus]|uniref:AAA+ ATPase domain-containing protein n=1 Tax=Stentor coeruleus TaxID=5963 RepID=A0A1R2BZL0_9CILI|nr:hypothetical protein SteCoe_17198 [Stentor coeruleus]
MIYLFKVGPSKPQSHVGEKSTTTFADVKGINECREELEEIVNILKNRGKYHKIGARMPRGILLTGPPGTGKTLLAKAIAGEAGVKFFNSSGSEFEEVFVGVGAKRIRDLFETAKKNSPSIIFIDEIDAVGGSRRGHGQYFHRQSLNQLLVEMDGFSERDNVIVIAATNLPESLDEALKRPGRFDKTIDIPMPDMKCRKDILDLYLGKISHDTSVNSEEIARSTSGFTGADLFNLVNMSMLAAIKAGRIECTNVDIEASKDRILLGVANKSMIFTDEEKYNIALHEAGHVLAILYTEGAEPLHKTSILRRGNSYGKTTQLPENDRVSLTKKQFLAFIDIKLAGKILQELANKKDDNSTQCSNDLLIATENAHKFIRTGMFDELFGLGYYEQKDDMGPMIKNKVDQSVNILLEQSYVRVKQMLKDKVELGEKLAKELVKRETLTKNEVLEIVNRYNE